MAEPYLLIPGIGKGRLQPRLVSRERLYAAADHLLVVINTGYAEDYRRIFFRDIRYLAIRRTRSQAIQVVIVAGLMGLSGLLFLTSAPPSIPAVTLIVLMGFLMANLLRGPTCQCVIQTEVQAIRLPVPTRMAKVPALVAFLESRIEPATAPAANPSQS